MKEKLYVYVVWWGYFDNCEEVELFKEEENAKLFATTIVENRKDPTGWWSRLEKKEVR